MVCASLNTTQPLATTMHANPFPILHKRRDKLQKGVAKAKEEKQAKRTENLKKRYDPNYAREEKAKKLRTSGAGFEGKRGNAGFINKGD